MRPSLTVLLALLASTAALAGCISGKQAAPLPGTDGLERVQDRYDAPFNVTGFYSRTLQAGPYAMKPPQSVFVDVALPLASAGGSVLNAPVADLEPPRVHLGLFLPDVPAGTKVPVIADVGPYYGDGDAPALDPNTHRLGGFLIQNFVPHGFAVAQVSVFGTGLSNHCMDLMGLDEQKGIDAAVTWLGTQAWSNGNVGLIGRSYDGSTPWEAATTGNPHLKTIVPISGLTGMYELMWRNGTSEMRGPVMHNYVYGTFGIDSVPDPEAPEGSGVEAAQLIENTQTACADYLQGPAQGVAAAVTGSNLDLAANTYWTDRSFFDRALANYKGSVYLVQGLQDWNVKPHVVFPLYARMQATWETKGLFGQWNHMYPDRPSEHVRTPPGEGHEAFPASVRYDWAQDLLEWFTYYLKGTGPHPALHTEVQDNMGHWRIEDGTYPPTDAAWLQLDLGDDFAHTSIDTLQTTTPQPTIYPHSNELDPALYLWPLPVDPPQGTPATTDAHWVVYTLKDPLAEDTHVAGLARLALQVTPLASGGQVYAELRDATADQRLGHAIMDLRYAAGTGTGTADAMPVVPGVVQTAKMEFEIMDVLVPAGHRLEVRLSGTGREYVYSADPAALRVEAVGSILSLPTIPASHGTPLLPPAWSGEAKATAPQP
ncbi:MAG TPA: CocE/NonD family hydrolase [Candidatus Thermoplasmatota archaeon]|nr:CocE/NonD family hydrolase [Candidatus Thermoplasmatota archaeon]